MNKAFEETTMKNVAIDQFWSFKRRNGAQNWNLREKLSKIGPIENFYFWSKVNAKSQSQRILVWVGFGFLGRATSRAVDLLTSSYDMSLIWTRADVDMLAWIDDVIIWCQMTSAAVSARCRSVQCLPACGGVARNPGGAWWHVQRCMTTRFSGQVDRWMTSPSWRRMWLRSRLGVKNLRRCVWELQQPLSARGGVCGCHWRSSFWVSFARGRGARLWCWFHQAK